MKNRRINHWTFSCLAALAFIASCTTQDKSTISDQQVLESIHRIDTSLNGQIAHYVRNIFQDKNGDFWFGTNGQGVAYYDGSKLAYFTTKDGFDGYQITEITEDNYKNLWFATDRAIVKFEWLIDSAGNKKFTNYKKDTHFDNQHLWTVFVDKKNNIWAGSTRKIYKFDGLHWIPFPLPYSEKIRGDFVTKATSWSIIEDQRNNIWFSTNGFGVYKYDGQSFQQYSILNGLADNRVDQILEDSQGQLWFATRFGGLSRYDGMKFINYTESDSIGNNEVMAICEDTHGNIWFASKGHGVYCYNGKLFRNYHQAQGLAINAVQSIYEDQQGRIWAGGGGGLYRLDGEDFINIRMDGPWN